MVWFGSLQVLVRELRSPVGGLQTKISFVKQAGGIKLRLNQ